MSNPITSILSRRRFRFTKILRRASMGATSTAPSRSSARSVRLSAKSRVRSMARTILYRTGVEKPKAATLVESRPSAYRLTGPTTGLPARELHFVEEEARAADAVVARELPGEDPLRGRLDRRAHVDRVLDPRARGAPTEGGRRVAARIGEGVARLERVVGRRDREVPRRALVRGREEAHAVRGRRARAVGLHAVGGLEAQDDLGLAREVDLLGVEEVLG